MYSPVTEHDSLGSRRSDGQLERRVKIVLLLIWAMDHLSSSDHQKARVSKVTRVKPVAPSIQNHNTGCAAPYKHSRKTMIRVKLCKQEEDVLKTNKNHKQDDLENWIMIKLYKTYLIY